jgi:hypothetical protein
MYNPNFCLIINQYCDTLENLLEHIYVTIEFNVNVIEKKKKRTIFFDKYIKNINDFTLIVNDISLRIRLLIADLLHIFIQTDSRYIISFMSTIRSLIEFMCEQDIFIKISEISETLKRIISDEKEVIKYLKNIRVTLFSIMTIAITISAIFIPALGASETAMDLLKDYCEKIDTKKTAELEEMELKRGELKHIIEKILDLRVESEMFELVSIDIIEACIRDKNAESIYAKLLELKEGYRTLILQVLILQNNIKKYKKKNYIFCPGMLFTYR